MERLRWGFSLDIEYSLSASPSGSETSPLLPHLLEDIVKYQYPYDSGKRSTRCDHLCLGKERAVVLRMSTVKEALIWLCMNCPPYIEGLRTGKMRIDNTLWSNLSLYSVEQEMRDLDISNEDHFNPTTPVTSTRRRHFSASRFVQL